MYPDVIAFAPLPDGKIYVEFDTRESGVFDMTPYMKSLYFSCLKDVSYFNRAYIEFGVITWPDGQDISPSTIRLEMVRQDRPEGIHLKTATLRQ
jgi:hypothetical protein